MTEQEINNLLSGLFGAIIAVLMTPVINRITAAIRLNNIRKTLLNYLKYIALGKIDKYAEDMLLIKSKILEPNEKMGETVDAMPMLTSEIFKSYTPDELNRVCYSSKNYIELLDIYYSIDFLKSNMPIDIYSKYVEKIENHFEEKNIEGIDAKLNHCKTCDVLKSYITFSSNNAEQKIKRAVAASKQIKTLLKSIKGNSIVWIVKYTF